MASRLATLDHIAAPQTENKRAADDPALEPSTPRWPLVQSFLAVVLVLAVGSFAAPALAFDVNDEIGFSPKHIFDGAIQGENIDVLNGNVNLQIPLGPRYMLNDWFGYQLTLQYNSKIWMTEYFGTPVVLGGGVRSYLRVPDTYGAGFSLGFGRIYHDDDTEDGRERAWIYHYQSADGADHMFCDWANYTSECEALDNPQESVEFKTFDEPSFEVRREGVDWVVYPGDGTKITFGYNDGDYTPRPISITDDDHPSGGFLATRIETLALDPRSPKRGSTSTTCRTLSGEQQFSTKSSTARAVRSP